MLFASVELNGSAPSEFLLMPMGEWKGFRNMGSFKEPRIIRNTPEKLKAAVDYHNLRRQRNPNKQLPIDYEHQSVTGDIAPAAGWISNLELRDDGVHATGVDWTPRGKKHIEEKEYKYLSPWWYDEELVGSPYFDKATGEKVPLAVFGAGLTNNPFFDEFQALVSKDGSRNLYIVSSHNFQEDTMDKVLQFILTFLALASGTSEDAIVAKANGFVEQMKGIGIVAKEGAALTAETVIEKVKGIADELKTVKANYALVAKALGEKEDALPEKLTALIASAKDTTGFVAKSEFAALQARELERDVKEFLAASANKVTAATYNQFLALGKSNFQQLKDLVAKMPVIVNTNTRFDAAPERSQDLTDVDVLVAKQLGVKEDILKKHAAAKN